MVDGNNSCLNREEHFVKGDLFDVYTYQVFVDRDHRKKIVIRHPHLFTEYSVCYLYLIPIRIVKGCIENGEMENERPEAMCFSGRIQPIL